MNGKREYNFLCRKCESFFNSDNPEAYCDKCGSDEDVLLLKSRIDGNWESRDTNPFLGYLHLAHILEERRQKKPHKFRV